MSSPCFVSQVATKEILIRVTQVCAECYSELQEGDTIHYDMQQYRYLCDCCQQKLESMMDESCQIIQEEAEPSLFC